ncbi:MAG: ketosteroid isomerase-related protein [Pseudomonadota bacterium]
MNQTVTTYFDAFNAGDVQSMLACLSADVVHHVNEGKIRVGKEKFAAFCEHMNRCYQETLTNIVVFEAVGGTRAAAEFIVNGVYLETDEGLPDAHGQTYRLPAGSFFDLKDGKITRVTTYYNLADWTKQVSGG